MTQPHLMNCPHSEEGWCLSCLKVEWDRFEEITSEIHHSLEPVACEQCAALQVELVEARAEIARLRYEMTEPIEPTEVEQ